MQLGQKEFTATHMGNVVMNKYEMTAYKTLLPKKKPCLHHIRFCGWKVPVHISNRKRDASLIQWLAKTRYMTYVNLAKCGYMNSSALSSQSIVFKNLMCEVTYQEENVTYF
jgi:hypothetical protein